MKSIIHVKNVAGQSRATRLLSQKPLRIIPTSSQSDEVRLILSSYGGGMLQGDKVELDITCSENAELYLGSQANNHIFKSDTGRVCEQEITATLEAGSSVVINPEPTVLHRDGRFKQTQTFNLKGDASLVLVDWIHSGRSESGERYEFSEYTSFVEIQRNGNPVMLENFSAKPQESQLINARFGPYNLMLNIYCTGSQTEELVSKLSEFRNKEVIRLTELTNTPEAPYPDCYYGMYHDAEADITVFRALAKKRSDLESVVSFI